MEPHETRVNQGQGPFATRTIFGWTVNGPLVRMGQPQPVCNFVKADDHSSFERSATGNSRIPYA